jgi:hypothetical protein
MTITAPKPAGNAAGGARWATLAPGTSRLEPVAGAKDTGFIDGQRPAFNIMNWLLGVQYDWQQYCEDAIDQIEASKVELDSTVPFQSGSHVALASFINGALPVDLTNVAHPLVAALNANAALNAFAGVFIGAGGQARNLWEGAFLRSRRTAAGQSVLSGHNIVAGVSNQEALAIELLGGVNATLRPGAGMTNVKLGDGGAEFARASINELRMTAASSLAVGATPAVDALYKETRPRAWARIDLNALGTPATILDGVGVASAIDIGAAVVEVTLHSLCLMQIL